MLTRPPVLRLARLVACAALLAPPALAHDGPPYPIFVDEDVAGWTLSIWADPDVGTGTFYYYVDAPEGRTPDQVRIRVSAAPEDGLAPPVQGESELAEPDEPFQQIATVEFAHRGTWPTRFELHATGDERSILGELVYELDVTPPGLGLFYVIWYAIPFLAIGAIWLRVLIAKRAWARANPPTPST